MVSCNLFGRYGNQLFQVAATIAYALKYDMEFSIPETGLNFGIKTRYNFPNQKNTSNFHLYNQPDHGYTEIPFIENVRLNGHFQSEKYFDIYKNEIRKQLGFPEAIINKCAIHVRRGDYIQNQNRFPLLSMAYYLNAVSYYLTISVCEFVIFSDDIRWCKDNFGSGYDFYNTGNDVEDLKHMADYKYMIIANSSYSLFASLINDKDCVIAPNHKSWFGESVKLKTEDLLPERFIQL